MQLNNLLNRYEQKMKRDMTSQLHLADVITIRELLRDKLHREVQGFRTSSEEYKELEQVNPNDIRRVVRQVRQKIDG